MHKDNINKDISLTSEHKSKSRWWVKCLKVTGISVASLIVLVIILITGVTLWLTPRHLTELINREASSYLKADVRVRNARFTLWSEFPHFYLEFDSLRINSRTLKSAPESIRKSLPANQDFLASAGKFKGSINLLHLFAGRIDLRNVTLEQLNLNLVAYNDSINNFDILPRHPRNRFVVPRFSADHLQLIHPGAINYYSAATATTVKADIKNASLNHLNSRNDYRLKLKGAVNVNVENLDVLHEFPFDLYGEIKLKFFPFRAKFVDYAIDLGNVKGKINMDLNLGDKMAVNNLTYDITAVDLPGLLGYIPALQIPYLSDIKTNLRLLLSARLAGPYKFSSTTLPDIDVSFRVPSGEVDYTVSEARTYKISDVSLSGRFFFNGKNPPASNINIDYLHLAATGMTLDAEAQINNLMGSPHIVSELQCKGDMSRFAAQLKKYIDFEPRGMLNLRVKAVFDIPDISVPEVSKLNLSSQISIDKFGIKTRNSNFAVRASHIDIKVSGMAGRLDDSCILAPEFTMISNMRDLQVEADAETVKAMDLRAEVAMDNSKGKTNAINFNDVNAMLPLDLKISSSKVMVSVPSDTLGITFVTPSLSVQLRNGSVASRKSERKREESNTLQTEYADSQIINEFTHSSEFLRVKAPEPLKNFITDYAYTVRFTSPLIAVSTPAFSVPATITGVSLTATPDKVSIGPTRFRAEQTAMAIQGEVSGLHEFLLSAYPAPLYVNMDVAMDTININKLARAYEQSLIRREGSIASLTAPKPKTVAASDTVAFLIPRNIKADIRATAKETRYSDLHLYNLATTLHIDEGNANVENLTIDSDFGSAYLDLLYATNNISNLHASLNVGLENIDVMRFFERFHTLLEMMPEMHNLSGFVTVKCSGGMRMYPTMYLNVPSTEAVLDLQGRSLTVHQSDFIRHITRMMLIHTDNDLHIRDMNVHAAVHDNLVELYPFDFEFDQYRLRMAGNNNFDGDLYYHIGILQSPIHLPFGINIVGDYSHPRLRFGGPHFKADQAEKIARHIATDDKINLVYEMKYYCRQFIHHAAQIP